MEPQKKGKLQSGSTRIALGVIIFVCFSFLISCGGPSATESPEATTSPGATEPPEATDTKSIGEETIIALVKTVTAQAAGLATATPSPSGTAAPAEPPATLSLQQQLEQVDAELAKSVRGNFTYIAPKVMKLRETFTIELLVNPTLSARELATQIVERSGLVTSTAEPGVLLSTSGGEVRVVGSHVEIMPLMKAVLLAEDPGAFNIQPIHDNEVQIVGKNSTTAWRWLVTADKGGVQKLILIIYRQVKIDKEAYWRDVQTYRAEIDVDVTFTQWLGSLDWKWIVGLLVTALLIPAFWRWIDRRKKQAVDIPKPKRQKKKTQ